MAESCNQIQTLKKCLCYRIYCAQLGPRLLGLTVQSLIGSPGTLDSTAKQLYFCVVPNQAGTKFKVDLIALWTTKAEFQILYTFRFAGLFLNKEIYTRIPRADPLNSLDDFWKNGRSFPGLGHFELYSYASRLVDISPANCLQNCTKKLVVLNIILQC